MNTKLLSVVVAVASTLFVALSARAEFTCELSFPSAPSTALANFPVLVRLADDAPTGFSYTDCPTGDCIWFTDANDEAIPCDVDTWDTTSNSLVWVSVPSLSSSAKITMHWDASGAPAGQPASSNVWSRASYVGVWHMNELLVDGTGTYTPDASGKGWNAYKANETDGYPVTISDAGNATSAPPTGHAMVNQLGGNRNIGGFLVPASATSGTTIGPFTVSFFEECTSTGNDRAVAFGSSHTEGCVTAAKSNTYVMAPGGFNTFDYSDGLADNAWRHIAGVFDTNLAGYVGGAYRNLNKNVGNKYSITLTKGIGLGTFTTQGETFTGYLDEIRIRNVASTGEWIAEEYKTVTTANYVTFGEVDTGVEVLRLGAAAVSDVTATNAVVTGELRTLGEDATSADIWLVYTDGTTTNAVSVGSTNAAPTALSFTLGNLAALTTYTCWFTATNSLSAGADSKTATFKTKYLPTGSGIFECELSFPSAPATPLENFPVLVRLSESGIDGFLYETCPTAANLWFTDDADEALPFEVDTWNTEGESLVWVSVPSLSNAATITMHWSANEGDVEDSPSPSQVWTLAGYNAVWHFNGSAAESANGLVASVTKGSPTYDGNASYPSPLGKTLWLANNSTLGYAVDPAWTTLGENASLTISCLARPVTASLGKYARMVCCQTSWDVKHGYTFAVHDPINKITLGSSDSSELALNSGTGGWTGWPSTDWVHLTARYDNTTGAIFKDGQTAISGEIKTLITPQGVLYLGANGDGNQRFWVGGLDEIRIRAAASSDDWVAAEYATIATADYVSFGDVEEASAIPTLAFGAASVSSVSAMGATLRVRLKGLGENATAADVALVVSGFGQTRVYPFGGVSGATNAVVTLSNLQPGAEWTAYFTATNNAAPAVGTNSAAVVFSTVSDAVSPSAPPRSVSVLSAVRDGTLLSARVALDAAAPGETSVFKYVFGTTHGGDDPAEWEGCGLVDSALPAEATTNDYLVGIATDMRYVRFYIDDNGAIAWSSTISLDWVSETEICDGVVFTDLVSASSVTDTGAVVTAHIISVGDSATAADVWAVVTGFGRTRTFAVTNAAAPATIVASLSDLQPGTEWTVYFTATNNAAPAVGTNSAAVIFSTVSDAGFVGTPGLYQAASSGQSNASDAAHSWNIAADGVVTPGPQAMRHANSWTSADGTTFQWANGAAFAYTGYMYMESGKDYYFSAAIDDAGYAWVNDGSGDWYAARQSPQFNTTWKADGPYNVSESGYHQVVFSAWNNSGGAGATGNNMLRYVAVAPGASAPAQASADWLATVDPGDGSLFLPTPPVRAVSVVSARRDGTVVSAKVALEAAVAGETSELLYVYGATHGGNNPTNWTGRGLVDSSPATSAVTNDYLVGIASDTRYIRFYTKSGDSVNWSATIAVEWAEETTLAETFVFTGEISASDVATTNATILGHLAALGDGATSADVWLVLSGFGQTKTYAVTHLAEGAELSAALADLIPGTEWTVHFTATNNLGAGADSPAFTFSTLSDSGAAGVSGFYQVRITSQNTLRSAATLDIVGDADGTLVAPAPHGLRAAVGVPWYSTDGTQWTYGGNTGYGYSGYMFMEGGKDYYFSAGIDDEGHVWVDNGAANWDAAHTASQFPSSWAAAGPFAIAEDGWYHVVFAGWNGGGNGGANGTYGPLRYIAVESGASAPVKESTAWIDAVDPGDGSLFLSDKPSRKVAVLSADRDGDLLSAKVALGAAFAGETSVLRYVYGASNGGNDPADWEGGSLVSAALPPGAVTNDYLVGIAANTRFVRFYATDGISLTWSDTIALEWSGETEVVEKFIFLGDPEASSISGDSATLSAVLNVPEAASAQAWFVLAGGGETLLIPAGTITARTNLAVAVTGLASETTYTFYATATNNVATPVGADSAVATFTTGPAASAWRPDRAVVTQDGKLFTIQVEVPYAGIGTTTLYLMTGSNWNNENTVSDSAVVTGPGVYSLAVDFSDKPWGHAFYYSLKLVNGTAENAITNWPNATSGQPFYNKSATIQDNSTYTWVGGATGVWNDTNNWTRTATGSCAATGYVGYPVIGSTVIFAAAADTDPVTVTIPATAGTSVSGGTPCWGAGTINLNGMLAPITFTSAVAGNDNRLQFGGLNADNANLDVTFDGCYFNTGSAPHIGANAAVDGRNAVLTFKNGARGYFSQLWVDKPAAKVRVLSGALLEDGYFLSGVNLTGEENRPVLEVEDAEYVNKANSFAFDWNNGNNTNGPLVRLLGTHPRVSSINFNMTRTAGGTTAIFEFVVPAGGYAYAPVHFLSDSAFNSTLRSPITLKVSPDSPALKAGFATTTRLVDAKLVDVADEAAAVVFDLPSGVTASRHTNEDGNEEGYDVSIPAGAGPALSNVAIVSCKDDSFTIGGDVLIATANELATITSYVAEGEGDFVASGSKTSGGGTFKVKASGLVSGANYRWYVEAITPSGSFRTAEQALTFHPGEAEVSAASVASIKVDGEKVYVFTNSLEVGSITFSRGGLVEVLVVGGGGAGGNAMGGGGGAGAFLYRRDFIPAGTYDVTVGKGGSNTDNNQSNYAIPAESSSIGDIFVAPGGGAGGHWGSIGLNQGGSAGGNSGNANVPAVGTYPLGRDGGSQTTGGKYLGSGGGGAGGAGHDARTWGDVYYGGRGGDGVACSITGEEKIYAAGGGGGAGTAGYIPGSAGLGGVRGCGMADEEIFDAPANTGSGGGGGNWQNNAYRMGGSGGSGIVVIRVKKFNKIGFSIIVR